MRAEKECDERSIWGPKLEESGKQRGGGALWRKEAVALLVAAARAKRSGASALSP